MVGYIKRKSAVWIAQNTVGRRRSFGGQKFWARGCFVSTVARDEQTIRRYIAKQEAEDRKLDQGTLFDRANSPGRGASRFERLTPSSPRLGRGSVICQPRGQRYPLAADLSRRPRRMTGTILSRARVNRDILSALSAHTIGTGKRGFTATADWGWQLSG